VLWSICDCTEAAAHREDVVFISRYAVGAKPGSNLPPTVQEEPSESCISGCPQCWLYARKVLSPLGELLNNTVQCWVFFYWWGGTKSLGTAATSGLLYNPR
jgi:hypothetical protein